MHRVISTATRNRSQIHQHLKRCLSTEAQINVDNRPDSSHARYFTPENGYVYRSGYQAITIPEQTIEQFIWHDMPKWQNKIAMVCGKTGRNYTYAKLRDRSAALAVSLQTKFQLNKLDTIAVVLPNVPEFPIAVLGAFEAGFIVSTLNPIYTAHEISRLLKMSNSKLIIGTVDNYPTLRQACQLANINLKIITIRTDKEQTTPEGAIDFFELTDIKNVDITKYVNPNLTSNDTAILPFSSGTTGLPKGVMLTHRNIVANSLQIDVPLPTERIFVNTTKDYQDVLPLVLPLFHIYGFTVTMISKLALGCKMVTIQKYHPDTLLSVMAEHKATFLYAVPPILIHLSHYDKFTHRHYKHLRLIMSGAAPIGASDVERFLLKARTTDFIQGYGMTETAPVVFLGHRKTTEFANVGWTLPETEAKIVDVNDPTWKGLDVNMEGELLLRGPQVMKGYLDNPKATAETLLPGGWCRTGDVGCYDEKGYFYIKDRLKELIKVQGYQVPPAELEELLRAHPDVRDAAVIGQSHEKYGEVPLAFIVRKDGSKITDEQIKEYVKERVAVYKRLGEVKFLDQIPKSTTGKIMRKELKAQYAAS